MLPVQCLHTFACVRRSLTIELIVVDGGVCESVSSRVCVDVDVSLCVGMRVAANMCNVCGGVWCGESVRDGGVVGVCVWERMCLWACICQ